MYNKNDVNWERKKCVYLQIMHILLCTFLATTFLVLLNIYVCLLGSPAVRYFFLKLFYYSVWDIVTGQCSEGRMKPFTFDIFIFLFLSLGSKIHLYLITGWPVTRQWEPCPYQPGPADQFIQHCYWLRD